MLCFEVRRRERTLGSLRIERFTVEQTEQTVLLFTQVFADAEGAAEGKLIGELVAGLIGTTAAQDILGFVAGSDSELLGSLFFTRLWLADERTAFLLSPMAVATSAQGKGIGQQLIHHGISQLRTSGADLVVTYGDPAFYTKVGFRQISEAIIPAPLLLSQPHGWLAQPLQTAAIAPAAGPSRCVAALSDQRYW